MTIPSPISGPSNPFPRTIGGQAGSLAQMNEIYSREDEIGRGSALLRMNEGGRAAYRSRHMSFAHVKHHTKSRLAAHHAFVAGSGLFERQCLDHGANPCEGAKVQRVFGISGSP